MNILSGFTNAIGDSLRFDSLSHSYDGQLVVDNITFSVDRKGFVGLFGPSGCGKTTLLKCAAGLISPSAGSVTLDGALPDEARRKGEVGFAFQSPTLLPWRTAIGNVLLPLELLHPAQSSDERYAKDLLDVVGLKDYMDKYPRELSGGMQQRVGLARALVTHPSYLFLDEPFGALDPTTRDRLNEIVRRIWREFDLTILFVTHSIEEAVFLADELVVLTTHPARILREIPIPLGVDRDYPTRLTKEFLDYTQEIRELTRGMS